MIRAAVEYWAEFPDEIDDRIAHAREAEAALRERWRRANGVVGKSSGTFLGPDRLLIDETFSDILALRVSELGVDAQSVPRIRQRRSHGEEKIVEAALTDDRVIVTDNVLDFEMLRTQREAEGRSVPGIIYVTDIVPRDQKFIADMPNVLARAASEHLASGNGVYSGWIGDALRPVALGGALSASMT